jgi:hypothetical protein
MTTPRKRAPRKSVVKTETSMVDKAIELIKWVDTPFKLFEVILLASVFFLGYFAWDSRQVILHAITSSSHVPKIREVEHLMPIAERLQKDLEATTVVVFKANLTVNSRTTMLSLNEKGRDKELDGMNSSLFSQDPARNAAIIAMLNGEVQCANLVVSGKSSEWESKQGVKFVCRGSIPPEMGAFDGYTTVGFKSEPSDLNAVKTRINLASTEMAK